MAWTVQQASPTSPISDPKVLPAGQKKLLAGLWDEMQQPFVISDRTAGPTALTSIPTVMSTVATQSEFQSP